MKVLVLGGTGYLGRAIVRALESSGHEPVVVVREPSSGQRRADLAVPASLSAIVTDDVDAVVHAAAAYVGWETEAAGIRTLQEALGDRRLVYTSGVWVLGATSTAIDESAPVSPIELVSGRPDVERLVREGGGVVIRPGVLHGEGKGLVALLDGRYVGTEPPSWPMVHVDDAARLFVLALERAEPGGLLHAVAEPAVNVRDLAIASHGEARPWPEAVDELGAPFAEALGLSQVVTAPAARALGWVPQERAAVASAAAAALTVIGRT